MKTSRARNLLFFTVLCCAVTAPALADPPHNALIVTGQNNHDWKMSVPILKQTLEDTGLFTVDIATSPAAGEDMSGFRPDFAAYDLLVLDYNGDSWCEAAKAAFLDYVRTGGGVVIYHAADNAFPDWPEFNEIIGLGGWGNRNEKDGPYVRWRDGAIVRDTHPGPGGGHGKQHDFQVINRVTDHPITQGLPEKWMHAEDELYDKLRGPAKNMTVLATAYSDKKQNGTGEHEPVLMTIAYGQGRIFHTVLGHAGGKNPPPAMQCVGFIVTFQRGAEWAATGAVTQPLPEDFPSADTVSKWTQYRPFSFEKALAALKAYQFNDSLEHRVAIENMLRNMTAQGKPLDAVEEAFLDFLTADNSLEAKLFVCQKLSMIGTDRAVPLLAELLKQQATAYMARYALTRIPGAAAEKALLDAMAAATGEAKIPFLTSLAQRGKQSAVPAILPLLQAQPAPVVVAAIAALSELGGPQALQGLQEQRSAIPPEARPLLEDALLHQAQQRLHAGEADQAHALYQALYKPENHRAVRTAALRGMIKSLGDAGSAPILAELNGQDSAMQSVAIAAVREVRSVAALKEVAAKMTSLPPVLQEQLLASFADRGAPEVLAAVMAAADHQAEGVRIAALKALGDLGAEPAVPFLAGRAATAKGAEKNTAWESLCRIHGAHIDAAFLAALADTDAPVQVVLLKAIADRQMEAADTALLNALNAGDADVQRAALATLAEIGVAASMPPLVTLLANTDDGDVRQAAIDTLVALAGRAPNQDQRADALLEALPNVDAPQARGALMSALGKIGAEAALPALYKALKSPDPALSTAAIEGLSAWPNPAPATRLLNLARRQADRPAAQAALLGYIRLAGLASNGEAEKKVRMYERAASLASTTEERKAICEGLAAIQKAEALPALYAFLKGDDADAAAEAIKGLAAWPDAAPLDPLLALARTATYDTHQVLALRGSVKLIALDTARSADEITALYKETMQLAPNAEERKAVLSALAKTPNIGALRLAVTYLDDEALHAEAEVAVAKLAEAVASSYPSECKAALETVLAQTEFDFVKQQAQKALEQLKGYADYLTAWEVSPFYAQEGVGGADLFDVPFAPEKDGEAVAWKLMPVGAHPDHPFLLELDKLYGGDNRVAYLRTAIHSETDQPARLELGSDDGVKIWLNGQQVYSINAVRPCKPGQDKIDIQLKAGWNPMQIKLIQVGGQWALCTRLRTPDGSTALPGVKADPRGK